MPTRSLLTQGCFFLFRRKKSAEDVGQSPWASVCRLLSLHVNERGNWALKASPSKEAWPVAWKGNSESEWAQRHKQHCSGHLCKAEHKIQKESKVFHSSGLLLHNKPSQTERCKTIIMLSYLRFWGLGVSIGQQWERLIVAPQCLGLQLRRVGGMGVTQTIGLWNYLEAHSLTCLSETTQSLNVTWTVDQSTYTWPLHEAWSYCSVRAGFWERASQKGGPGESAFQESQVEVHDLLWSNLRNHIAPFLPYSVGQSNDWPAQILGKGTQTSLLKEHQRTWSHILKSSHILSHFSFAISRTAGPHF